MQLKKRFWEVDFLRGIAIIMMIIYHSLWDFNYFYNSQINLFAGFWKIFQIITASLFLLLVGISLTLSNKENTKFKKYFRRGMKIFSFGLIITLITFITFPKNFIIFGILHLIGLSIILSYLFRNLKYSNLIIGLLSIIIGLLINNIFIKFNWLLIFGLHSNNFQSLDYFPIFPWFGIILIGLFIGKLLYSKNKRTFEIKENSNNIIKFISYLGKKSLIIYLLHQILLYGLFYFFSYLSLSLP